MAQVKLLKIANNVPTEHTGASDDLTINSLATDTIDEQSGAAGVTIDGVLLKDSGATFGANVAMGDFSVTGVDTITFTDTSGTIAGIQNQNLLDKSATETVSGTWTFSANLAVGGTVDGRDLATDGTKLDGIEALADVTDATNVDAAGATMNSDSTIAAMSFVLDEDTMSSDSATKLATQQSIKAYVDSQNHAGASTETYTNGNGGSIVLGDVVYMTTTNDAVDLADADTIAQGDIIVGIAAATIGAAASGLIHVAQGKILAGALAGATAGDVYYLSATGTSTNTLTTTAPSGGPALVKIGFAKNATDLVFDPEFIADTTA
jgi:hypothetical protein